MKISKVKNGLVITANGPVVVSYIGTGEVLIEMAPQSDAQAAPARAETRGRKPKAAATAAPDLSGQTGTMFTPPITPRLRETE
jgi:hypothetical protein